MVNLLGTLRCTPIAHFGVPCFEDLPGGIDRVEFLEEALPLDTGKRLADRLS